MTFTPIGDIEYARGSSCCALNPAAVTKTKTTTSKIRLTKSDRFTHLNLSPVDALKESLSSRWDTFVNCIHGQVRQRETPANSNLPPFTVPGISAAEFTDTQGLRLIHQC